MSTPELPPEITDEQIYAELKTYSDGGMIDYVLPTNPLGEQWIIGWKGDIHTFTSKEGIVGFLLGVQVAAQFAINSRVSVPPLPKWGRSGGPGWPR